MLSEAMFFLDSKLLISIALRRYKRYVSNEWDVVKINNFLICKWVKE